MFCLQANVNGRVLSQCNIDELKKEMNMNFGDWQLFRATVGIGPSGGGSEHRAGPGLMAPLHSAADPGDASY